MSQKKVAIVDGIRTPFVKAGTSFINETVLSMGATILEELAQRNRLSPDKLDEFVFSTVLLNPDTPNWAREILFRTSLSKSTYAESVSNNCISGLVAISDIALKISSGRIKNGIAGGAESMSNPRLTFNEDTQKIFLSIFRAKGFLEKLKLISKLRPSSFVPQSPSVKEPSTGLTMGEHMELTAKKLNIPREDQDRLAYASHQNAIKAIQSNIFAPDIIRLNNVEKDLIPRKDTSLEKLASLKPVFDKTSGKGTLTAGNSSPLTDGASAVLLMDEDACKESGREVLAYIQDMEFSAMDPSEGLLMAPGVAVPKLLARNNLRLEDFDLIEIHEAFAAQVLANIKAWEEGMYGVQIGKVNFEKLNTQGGSIALGHPFAATGARMVLSSARQLHRENKSKALISICAAGGMAGAMILSR